jgi:hypothetical protein
LLGLHSFGGQDLALAGPTHRRVARFGRCGLSTQRYDANLRRWFSPKRAEDFGFDVHVDLTDAQSVGQRNYAAVTSGITFALHEPDAVLPRWQRQVISLRAAS